MPRFPTTGEWMWCKWCGEKIPKIIDGKSSTRRLWHPYCLGQFMLHTRKDDQFNHLVRRDGERCRCCPEGAPIPRRWINRGVISVVLPMPSFKHIAPVGSDEWMRLAAEWREANPSPVYSDIDLIDWLEVDHRTPLWEVAHLPDEERRWYFGPGNLWLLCGPHHKQKTIREAARRAEIKRLDRAQLILPL